LKLLPSFYISFKGMVDFTGSGKRMRIADADYGCGLRMRITDCGCGLLMQIADADCGCGLRMRIADADCEPMQIVYFFGKKPQ
jgi:hypothetical protein